METYHIMIIGVRGVGKKSFISQFVTHSFSESYDPSGELQYRKQLTVGKEPCMVELIEYENAEDDDMWKQILSSAEAAVFMYSISSKASLASAQDMWQKAKATKEEMGTWEPFQFCFLGNKADLEDEREVSREEGEAAAKSMECAFRECSAKVRTNIDETVEELVQKILTYRDNERIRYEQMKAQAEKGKKKKERSPFKRLFSK